MADPSLKIPVPLGAIVVKILKECNGHCMVQWELGANTGATWIPGTSLGDYGVECPLRPKVEQTPTPIEPTEEKEEEEVWCKVEAAKYVPLKHKKIRKSHTVQVWWKGGEVTWEPWSVLDDLDPIFKRDVLKNPCVRRKFTGSHDNSSARNLERFSASVPSGKADDLVEPVKSEYQKAGKLCALNAAVIALDLLGHPICSQLYSELEEKNPALEKVVILLRMKENGGFQFIKPKLVENTNLLSWLLEQVAGIFCVEYNIHCIVWDANRKVLMDTDPICPCPVTITDENLAMFGIKTVEKVYQALPKVQKKDKKRKRKD